MFIILHVESFSSAYERGIIFTHNINKPGNVCQNDDMPLALILITMLLLFCNFFFSEFVTFRWGKFLNSVTVKNVFRGAVMRGIFIVAFDRILNSLLIFI